MADLVDDGIGPGADGEVGDREGGRVGHGVPPRGQGRAGGGSPGPPPIPTASQYISIRASRARPSRLRRGHDEGERADGATEVGRGAGGDGRCWSSGPVAPSALGREAPGSGAVVARVAVGEAAVEVEVGGAAGSGGRARPAEPPGGPRRPDRGGVRRGRSPGSRPSRSPAVRSTPRVGARSRWRAPAGTWSCSSPAPRSTPRRPSAGTREGADRRGRAPLQRPTAQPHRRRHPGRGGVRGRRSPPHPCRVRASR